MRTEFLLSVFFSEYQIDFAIVVHICVIVESSIQYYYSMIPVIVHPVKEKKRNRDQISLVTQLLL